jgi:hypothetical protein
MPDETRRKVLENIKQGKREENGTDEHYLNGNGKEYSPIARDWYSIYMKRFTVHHRRRAPTTKEFCSGWKSATQFTLQQYKAGLTDGENYKSSHHDNITSTDTVKPEPEYKQVSVFCVPVRLPSLVWYQWCVW